MHVSNDKKVILLLIGGLPAVSLVTSLLEPDARDLVRGPLECALCWYLWKGANWARWIAGVLAAGACVMLTVSVLHSSMQVEAVVVLVVLALFYGLAGYVLLSRKWVATHFRTEPPNKPYMDSPRK